MNKKRNGPRKNPKDRLKNNIKKSSNKKLHQKWKTGSYKRSLCKGAILEILKDYP